MTFIPMDQTEGEVELTGNALPHQVKYGKTFYNTDPDIILTGAMKEFVNNKGQIQIESSTSVSTLPYNFYYGSAIVYNNEIHILGGSSNYTKHYKFNGSTWTSVSTLPYYFTNGSAVVYNNEIHILGGSSNNTTKHYKFNGSTWTSVSTLPYNFYYGSAIVYNNEIHILGSGNSSNYTKHYKWNGSTWTSVSTLPYNFYYSSAVVYNNEIHILGGYNYGTYHYKFNNSTLTWTSVSTLPYNFYYGCAVVYNNEIHILGGGGGNTKYYKFNGSTWTSVSTLPYNFYYGSAVVYNNEIHILGSYGSGNYTKHYKFNIIIKHSNLPYDFYEGSAVVYNNEIHILGSYSSGNRTKHYKFNGSTWTNASTLPYDFFDMGAVVYNNEIHILGCGSAYTRHYKWNGSTWTSVSTLPYSFNYGSAVVYNNEIHILGGGGGNNTKHYKFNGSTWTSVSTLPYTFYYGSAVVYNNEIHILGSGNNTTKHYKFNGSIWTSVSTLPYNFYYGSAIVYNNEIHILGGSGGYTTHYKFNGSTWTSVSTLPYDFYRGSAVVYNNEIYILGSYNSGNYTKHYQITINNSYIYYLNDSPLKSFDIHYIEDGLYNTNIAIESRTFIEETEAPAVTSNDILNGKTLWANGTKYTGNYITQNYLNTNSSNINKSLFTLTTNLFGKKYSDTTDSVYTVKANCIPSDQLYYGLVSYNDAIYCVYSNSELRKYDIKTGNYTSFSGPPFSFSYGGCLVMVDSTLYIFGQYGSSSERGMAAKTDLSKASPTWTSITNQCPNNQGYRCGCNLNGTMYLFGSNGYSYKFTGSAWTAISHSGMDFQYGLAVVQASDIKRFVAHIFKGYNHYTYDGTTFTLIDSNNPCSVNNTEDAITIYKDHIYIYSCNGYRYSLNTINNTWKTEGTHPFGSQLGFNSALECNGSIYFGAWGNLYRWDDDPGDKFTVESDGSLHVSDNGYKYKFRDTFDQSDETSTYSKEIMIPRGSIWMLVANSYNLSNGAYRGSNSYIIYASGGASSTTALRVPKATAFGANGSAGIKIEYSAQASGDGFIYIGPSSTAYSVEYAMYPLLTPINSFLY